MGTPPACPCGVGAAGAGTRCNACPLTAADAAEQPAFAGRRGAPLPSPLTTEDVRWSRWAKSQNSYGPTGRLVATFALLVPLVVLLATVVTGIGIVGAGIYGFVIVPWGLKDIWKKTKISSRAERR